MKFGMNLNYSVDDNMGSGDDEYNGEVNSSVEEYSRDNDMENNIENDSRENTGYNNSRENTDYINSRENTGYNNIDNNNIDNNNNSDNNNTEYNTDYNNMDYINNMDYSRRREYNSSADDDINNAFNNGSGIINKGPWSKNEDMRLRELVEKFMPRNWSFLARMLGTRQGKQCRERWHNHLDPKIKKCPFTKEEDELILRLHREMGNKWSEIAKYLPGRTDNAIKNYWNSSILRRQLVGRKRSPSMYEIRSNVTSNISNNNISEYSQEYLATTKAMNNTMNIFSNSITKNLVTNNSLNNSLNNTPNNTSNISSSTFSKFANMEKFKNYLNKPIQFNSIENTIGDTNENSLKNDSKFTLKGFRDNIHKYSQKNNHSKFDKNKFDKNILSKFDKSIFDQKYSDLKYSQTIDQYRIRSKSLCEVSDNKDCLDLDLDLELDEDDLKACDALLKFF